MTKKYTSNFAISKDGTKIHYLQIGSGEGLVFVHGSLMYSKDFTSLAEMLSNNFTVYIPDRCGRGLSEMHKNYSLQAESEDIQAVLDKTNAQYIFGLSSGAIITLQTAINNSSLKKVAVFEPTIYSDINNVHFNRVIENYSRAIAKQNFGKAFMNNVKGIGDSNSIMTHLPNFISVPLFNLLIKSAAKKKIENKDTHLKDLILLAKYDFEVYKQSLGMYDNIKNISAEILLLGGEKSHSSIKKSLNELKEYLPSEKKVLLPNTGHITANNEGKPKLVANELMKFFNTI